MKITVTIICVIILALAIFYLFAEDIAKEANQADSHEEYVLDLNKEVLWDKAIRLGIPEVFIPKAISLVYWAFKNIKH